MNEPGETPRAGDVVEQQAAAWVLRSDRGLSAAEQDEFSAWLAADPRHGAELARHRRHWRRLDALAEWRPEHTARPNPDLLAPPAASRVRRWAAMMTLAAAAAVALTVGLYLFRGTRVGEGAGTAAGDAQAANAAGPAQRVLPDGTRVELNRGAEFTVEFSAEERRVRFERGEAHFFVTKDPQRPFIVTAGGIDVRAVGTAFNVRIDPAAVEVLVTEGRVRVDSAAHDSAGAGASSATVPGAAEVAGGAGGSTLIPVLEARQRAVVPLRAGATASTTSASAATPAAAALALASQPAAPQIATLTPREIERVLAWQHRMLDFNAAPISEIVAEFNRRNVTQLAVPDAGLAATRMSVTMRSDNIEGFVRLLEAGFNVRAEKQGEGEIVLRKGK